MLFRSWDQATIRTWLNNDFAGYFYPAFEDKVLETEVPWTNTSTGGSVTDLVFIASRNELGGTVRAGDGTVFDWYSDAVTAAGRRGDISVSYPYYWTRTGELGTWDSQWFEMSADYVFTPDGNFISGAWSSDAFETVPVLNIAGNTEFEKMGDGRYRLFVAEPEIIWAAADITYGQTLADSDLSGSTAGYEGSPVAGTFTFDAPSTAPDAGTADYAVIFTPDDKVAYRVVTGLVTVNVNKATPVITWEDPTDITYGTALSAAQLNATADVAGTFDYTPALGTILNAGAMQTLKVDFTPDDSDNYDSAWKEVVINVDTVELTVTAEDKERNYGEENPAFTVTYSGFVSTDTTDDIDTLPIASTTADIDSPAGD